MREMLLSELVATYRPVYPEPYEWETTAKYLYAEQPKLMAELTASLLKEGWREPIILEPLTADSEAEDYPTVGDGTHRVVIALANGVFTVPVLYREEQQVNWAKELLEITIENRDEDLTEAQEDRLLEMFRSFELSKEVWLTVEASFLSGKRRQLLLNVDDEALAPVISRKARAMVKELFPRRRFNVTVAPSAPLED